MPEKRLTDQQTRARLRQTGIERTKAPAFAFSDDAQRVRYEFHTHRRHQLLYAVRGTARLEAAEAQFLLPPQRAVWIPAGLLHATHVGDSESVSVFFEPGWSKQRELRVFEVSPLLREMLLYARRWPLTRKPTDREVAVFFRSMLVVAEPLMQEQPAYELPRPKTEFAESAMSWVLAHLSHAQLPAAAKALGTTPRTLRRRFLAETGLHFRAFVMQARIQRAMELLGDPTRSIIQVGLEVGFQSPSAFSYAFRRATGQVPRSFRGAGRSVGSRNQDRSGPPPAPAPSIPRRAKRA